MKKRNIIVKSHGKYFIKLDQEKRSNDTIWSTIKKFINSIEVGHQFYRKDIINTVYKKEAVLYIKPTSIDCYRSILSRLEYIQVIKRGIYIKKEDIPENAPIALLKEFSINREDWKGWFIQKEEKRKQIKKICERESFYLGQPKSTEENL